MLSRAALAAAGLGVAFVTGSAIVMPEVTAAQGALLGAIAAGLVFSWLRARPAPASDAPAVAAKEDPTVAADALFERLLAQTADAVLLTDARNRIIRVNPAFTAITGYTADEAIGRNPSMLSSGRQGPEFYAGLWWQLNTVGSWCGEIWNRRKNGEIYPEWLTLSVIRNAAGEIVHHVASFSDITRRKQDAATIRELSSRDHLTGLHNAQAFREQLGPTVEEAARDRTACAVIVVDLENFGHVNDTLGHQVGDQVLVEIGRRLRAVARDTDIIARQSADEFTLLLPGLRDATQAAGVADQIGRQLDGLMTIDAHEISIRSTIGVAVFPDDAQEAAALLRSAQGAMHAAKAKGVTGLHFYSEEVELRMRRRLRLQARLRAAIDTGALTVAYQPKVVLADRSLAGFEALVRWNDDELGPVSPVEFIPAAEESGLIVDVGRLVLKQVFRDVRCWRDLGIRCGPVAVNVSTRELSEPGYAERLARDLLANGLGAADIDLEITEGALVELTPIVRRNLETIKSSGLKLAIDDFGTGYSSLSYLRNLDFDVLKVDQSFVRGVVGNDSDRAITRAILQLGGALSLDTVGEGVETEEQATFLLESGCRIGQGYLLGRPCTVAEATRLSREQAARSPSARPIPSASAAAGTAHAA